MRDVTDTEVEAALLAHVTTLIGTDGMRYFFGKSRISLDNPPRMYTHAQVSEIVRACLVLDLPVIDVPDAAAWVGMMTRLAVLENRVESLARGERTGRLL